MKDKLRMVQWLALALALYAIAILTPQPQIQTALWKLGNVTVAAFIGYWIDRRAFWYSRLDGASSDLQYMRRAIIMAAAMLAVALGL